MVVPSRCTITLAFEQSPDVRIALRRLLLAFAPGICRPPTGSLQRAERRRPAARLHPGNCSCSTCADSSVAASRRTNSAAWRRGFAHRSDCCCGRGSEEWARRPGERRDLAYAHLRLLVTSRPAAWVATASRRGSRRSRLLATSPPAGPRDRSRHDRSDPAARQRHNRQERPSRAADCATRPPSPSPRTC
jgi:hypothetical protein